MGRITIDQSHQVMATLVANTAWEEIDFEKTGLQNLVIRSPKEAGRQFTAFLKNGGRISVGGESGIIFIDRAKPFNPGEFMRPVRGGRKWVIEEQDERSLALPQVDTTKVQLMNMHYKGEEFIEGEEMLERLKSANYIRLDAKIFQTLWQNQYLIPEQWKEKTNSETTHIFFSGTVVRNERGNRAFLCLFWRDGQWHWYGYWLEGEFGKHGWGVNFLFAVLVS